MATTKKIADTKTKSATSSVTKKSTVATKPDLKSDTKQEKALSGLAKEEQTTKKVSQTKKVETSKNIAQPTKKIGNKLPKIKKDVASATYATGKRKNAIAKVWLKEGNGTIIINGKQASEYLKRAILDVIINQPFEITDTTKKFNVICTVLGGGLTGQAGAIKHGISIALQLLNPNLRAELKSAGFLTRDSRVVERKKPGLKKARKGQVYQRR